MKERRDEFKESKKESMSFSSGGREEILGGGCRLKEEVKSTG